MKHNLKLTIAQAEADILAAKDAIKRAESLPAKKTKYIKGTAGYHLQQASEKLIKIQLYSSGLPLEYSKLYKHSLDDLLIYAESLELSLIVPSYINKNKTVISSWEAQGRYDVHFVVRIDQLKKCLEEVIAWHNQLIKKGFK